MIKKNKFRTGNIYFEDDEDLKIIKASILKSRILQSCVSLILLVVSTYLLINSLSIEDNRLAMMNQIIGITICIVSCLLLFNALKIIKLGSSDLIDMLTYEPEKIVWVYYTVTMLMPFGIKVSNKTVLCLKDSKGKQHTIYVNNKRIIRLMNLLKKRLPHATFGYNHENEFLYKIHPALLRKD